MIANRVEEKTKEIGIRKVMGAHLHHVAQLLVRSSVLQLLIAVVAGIPIAYYLTQQYLNKFASRIDLKWWHGVIPILILTFIMIAVIASHLWKAMRANPVEALKHE